MHSPATELLLNKGMLTSLGHLDQTIPELSRQSWVFRTIVVCSDNAGACSYYVCAACSAAYLQQQGSLSLTLAGHLQARPVTA